MSPLRLGIVPGTLEHRGIDVNGEFERDTKRETSSEEAVAVGLQHSPDGLKGRARLTG